MNMNISIYSCNVAWIMFQVILFMIETVIPSKMFNEGGGGNEG